MDDARFDAQARRLGRRGLVASTLSGIALGLRGLDQAGHSKNRKRRGRKKKPVKCSQHCAGFSFCFNRTAGSRLCAKGYDLEFSDCSLCTTDQECVDTPYPYCMKSYTSVSTNKTLPVVTCDGITGSRCVSLFLA